MVSPEDIIEFRRVFHDSEPFKRNPKARYLFWDAVRLADQNGDYCTSYAKLSMDLKISSHEVRKIVDLLVAARFVRDFEDSNSKEIKIKIIDFDKYAGDAS